jgi:Flp pilus assembly protein TadB
MWGVVVFAVVVAFVAVLIAVAIAYWWVWLLLGGTGFAIYYFWSKRQQKANQV